MNSPTPFTEFCALAEWAGFRVEPDGPEVPGGSWFACVFSGAARRAVVEWSEKRSLFLLDFSAESYGNTAAEAQAPSPWEAVVLLRDFRGSEVPTRAQRPARRAPTAAAPCDLAGRVSRPERPMGLRRTGATLARFFAWGMRTGRLDHVSEDDVARWIETYLDEKETE